MSFISVNSCPHATGKSDCTHCNHYTEYDSKPPYPVQKFHLCHIGKGIMPYGNSSVVCQGIFRGNAENIPNMPKINLWKPDSNY